MPYLSFMSDKHFISCIASLHKTYQQCQSEMTLSDFYSNKVDPIKFHLDMSFNNLTPQNIS